MNVTSFSPVTSLRPVEPHGAARPANATGDIQATFSQALDSLSQSQATSDDLLRQLAAGENVDLHQVMIASEQTDIGFRVAMAMRDKLVEAYHEVMRMAV